MRGADKTPCAAPARAAVPRSSPRRPAAAAGTTLGAADSFFKSLERVTDAPGGELRPLRECARLMSVQQTGSVSRPAGGPLQRLWWGALPEALSAGCVAVLLAAVGALYLLTDDAWEAAGAGRRLPDGLRWWWGLITTAAVLVIAFLYWRLRGQARPLAAVQRNLEQLAAGVERDLATLALSDALGQVAQGWNRLLGQLGEAQRQLRTLSAGPTPENVLARFESVGFRRVLDRLPFGVLCVDARLTLRYVNDAAAVWLGRPAAELVGLPVAQVVDNEAVRQAVLAVRTRASSLSIDHTQTDGEQETTLRFRVLPPEDGAAGGDVLVTLEDIGALRETERARDRFLYHVTHELRTPLTNIAAYAETLTKPEFEDEQTRKECYNVIVSETRRLSRLVEDILSISQLEVGTARLNVGEVDLARLLRQMVQDNLGAADEKQIDLTLTLPPKVPKLRGDKQKLSVLVNNLVGNAIKYTPRGGQVQVKLDVTEQGVRIVVRDTGIGISPADQARIFEKFYRAADDAVQSVSGTGLGLAIAREVARLHGGDITVASALRQGSTFTVELPLTRSESTEVARQ